ncbi:flagellar hook-length control protein FliK [Pararhizobium sp.]|uniref:flagellar hook-length control protein FliK n=1 Tax=Pararhizobium sp. TaxID=1977563 RepID=UPI00271B800E|nr:flagellar hook-length control protein FliK [Pararhizobium sp.]MDO9418247.1 flagellar hook-length control protein FliK [Pararhizobium sp.]
MTSIDQALLGPVPAKTGSFGGKATAKTGDDKGSNGRDAFEEVFSKAAKKNSDRANEKSVLAQDSLPADTVSAMAELKMPPQAKSRFGLKEDKNPKSEVTEPELPREDATGETAKPSASVRAETFLSIKIKVKDDTRTEVTQIHKVEIEADDSAAATDVSKLMELLSAGTQVVNAATSSEVSDQDVRGSLHAEFQEISAQHAKADTKRETGTSARTSAAAADMKPADLEQAPVEADEIFRFARADGKGKPVEMKISGTADDARVSEKETAKAKIENVTVIESRRYLGLAANSNSNAAVLTAAMSGDPEWATAMRPSAALLNSAADNTSKVVNTLKLQMHPIDLGSVTATLRLTGDALNVDLRVETGEAYRQLSDDQNGILKALKAQGFAVDQLTIVLVQPDTSAQTGQQGDGSTQQQFNQSARDGTGNGPQQGRGQQDDNRQFVAGNGRGQNNDGTDEAVAAGGLQRNGSGHVYM